MELGKIVDVVETLPPAGEIPAELLADAEQVANELAAERDIDVTAGVTD